MVYPLSDLIKIAANKIAENEEKNVLDLFEIDRPDEKWDRDKYEPWKIEVDKPGYGARFMLNNKSYNNYYFFVKDGALELAKKVSKIVPYPVELKGAARIRATFEEGVLKSESPSLRKFYTNISDEKEKAFKEGKKLPAAEE